MHQAGHYDLMETLGKGGFGVVYRARYHGEGGFSKEVAVKLLHEDAERMDDVATRFRDEARLLGLIRHRAIVQVDRLTHIGDRWAVVMELVDGYNLKQLLTVGRVPAGPALEIIAEVASALHAAYHTVGPTGQPLELLHRDIKPSNIQLSRYGDVKLLDFGIARASFEQREAHTRSLNFGSAGYMAPERIDMVEGPGGDIYSLGAVLFELLSGRPVGPARAARIRQEPFMVSRLRWLEAEVQPHPEVFALLRCMLSWEPEERPCAQEVTRAAHRLIRELDDEPLRAWVDGRLTQVEVNAPRKPKPVLDLTPGSSQTFGASLAARPGTPDMAPVSPPAVIPPPALPSDEGHVSPDPEPTFQSEPLGAPPPGDPGELPKTPPRSSSISQKTLVEIDIPEGLGPAPRPPKGLRSLPALSAEAPLGSTRQLERAGQLECAGQRESTRQLETARQQSGLRHLDLPRPSQPSLPPESEGEATQWMRQRASERIHGWVIVVVVVPILVGLSLVWAGWDRLVVPEASPTEPAPPVEQGPASDLIRELQSSKGFLRASEDAAEALEAPAPEGAPPASRTLATPPASQTEGALPPRQVQPANERAVAPTSTPSPWGASTGSAETEGPPDAAEGPAEGSAALQETGNTAGDRPPPPELGTPAARQAGELERSVWVAVEDEVVVVARPLDGRVGKFTLPGNLPAGSYEIMPRFGTSEYGQPSTLEVAPAEEVIHIKCSRISKQCKRR